MQMYMELFVYMSLIPYVHYVDSGYHRRSGRHKGTADNTVLFATSDKTKTRIEAKLLLWPWTADRH